METIGSKRSYALIWCTPNNDDDDDTQFSVAYFLVSTLLSKIFDVGDRDLPVLTSGN